MHTSQLAIRSLELFRARSFTDSPSSFRLARMRLIGEMLELREYNKLVSSLVRSPNDLEYYKALLHGPDFTMNTGGKLFGRIEKVLVTAYEQGADLSDLLPVLKDRLSATCAVEANIAQAYAALNILGAFIEAIQDGKPSQKKVAEALWHSAVRINLDPEQRRYQLDIYASIMLKLEAAIMYGVKVPKGVEVAIYGRVSEGG